MKENPIVGDVDPVINVSYLNVLVGEMEIIVPLVVVVPVDLIQIIIQREADLEVAQETEEILIQVVQTLVQVAQLLLLIRLLPQVQVMVHLIVHHVV